MRATSLRRREAGFTLMELMVVVAIIAIFSSVLIGLSSRTYGANSKNVASSVSATLNSIRSRAIATRRIHRAYVTTSQILVWQSDTTGLTDDNDPSDDRFVLRESIPQGVTVYDVGTTSSSTAPSTQNSSVNYAVVYKPDGSSNGATVFLRDTNDKKYKTPIYKYTGSAFARAGW